MYTFSGHVWHIPHFPRMNPPPKATTCRKVLQFFVVPATKFGLLDIYANAESVNKENCVNAIIFKKDNTILTVPISKIKIRHELVNIHSLFQDLGAKSIY
jgi:hypothetical protein